MPSYNPADVERRWQQFWESNKTFRTPDPGESAAAGRPPLYVLDMFPYPSGSGLHVGHPEGYTATDIYSRFKRMNGFNVLHPMGWDAYGLPAEQYAVEKNVHPRITTQENINTFRRQIKSLGFSYDWDREVDTTDPKYFRWTQWIFLVLYDTWYDPVLKKGRPISELPIPESVKGDAAIRCYQDSFRLAYQAEVPVNWCPALGTVLANEEVIDGKSERGNHPVERRPLRQWLMRITAYAERLLEDLDGLDWSESIKQMQRNWIGRSEGAEVDFKLASGAGDTITVFTTRPDTLFGATYMVLSPEHHLVDLITTPEQASAVKAYQEAASRKSEFERTELAKTKTGVFTGAYAINPVNKKKIPIWIADYVLAGYGTGAIMAVPAHDERDFEFAMLYREQLAEQIGESRITSIPPQEAILKSRRIRPDQVDAVRQAVQQNPHDPSLRHVYAEILDELGFGFEAQMERFFSVVPHAGPIAPVVQPPHSWFKTQEKVLLADQKDRILPQLLQGWEFTDEVWTDAYSSLADQFPEAFADEGIAINSSSNETGLTIDGLPTAEAKAKIIAWLEEKKLGHRRVNYKLRDWLFSRQRYWGEPFPILHGPDGETRVVSELPLVPPDLADFKPTGTPEGPLSKATDWVNVTIDGKPFKRETNTMPQWAGSCWYFLRYIDPHNDRAFADPAKLKYWLPVNLYIGGAEHAVLHLLYSRFWVKVLFDRGHVPVPEPFHKLVNQGMILGENGEKMSKARGNVVNPDDIVKEYGADSMRLYEMFMGPLEAVKPWSTKSIEGVYRFLSRAWRMIVDDPAETMRLNPAVKDVEPDKETLRVLHRTIQKVGEDTEGLRFNTAISAMMEFVNHVTKLDPRPRAVLDPFVLLLAPYAPHIAEELWAALGHKNTLAYEPWPKFDPALTKAEEIEIPVQVNGKLKARLKVPAEVTDAELEAAARADATVQAAIAGKTVKMVKVVPKKLVNIVIAS